MRHIRPADVDLPAPGHLWNESAADGKTRILVVDDEPQIRRFLETTLEVNGYEVALASDGREALARAVEWHPDALLLDLGLLEIDGLEVCRQVQAWQCVSTQARRLGGCTRSSSTHRIQLRR